MNRHTLLALRLQHQRLIDPPADTPAGVVRHMGAMQAQVFSMAQWAIGLRLPASAHGEIADAYNQCKILRTHLLRPTWHFVAPEDIRWLLKLTSPHVQRVNAFMYKRCELDEDTRQITRKVIASALQDRTQKTREELAGDLANAGILAKGHRLSYIMMDAELESVVASGPMRGKQFTYRLLDDLVQEKSPFIREEALQALAQRYFASRGPATIQDFATWSGLPIGDARKGAFSLGGEFIREAMEGGDVIYEASAGILPTQFPTFPMPDYDEYAMGYKDRSALMAPGTEMETASSDSHWLVLQGIIQGTWQYPSGRQDKAIAYPFHPLEEPEKALIAQAMARHRLFWQ